MSGAALEDAFLRCPECHAPWKLHWVYVWEDGEKKRRYNTCGWRRDQLEAKWLSGGDADGFRGQEPTP